jgi:lysophospholipase L1-like esterase
MPMQQKPTSKIYIVLCLALGAIFLSCGGSDSAVEVYGENRTPESNPVIKQTEVISKASKAPLLSVVVIGDSLTVGSEMYGVSLTRSLLNAGVLDVVVSAKNGRTTSEGVDKLEDSMVVDGAVVIALGTNDVAMASPDLFGTQIDRAVAAVPETVKIFWLNLYTDQWISDDAYNAKIIEKASAHPNLSVMDFESFASPTWVEEDGIHLTPDGYIQRTRFILQELGLN